MASKRGPDHVKVVTGTCLVDGGALIEAGWCVVGKGYPIPRACPFLCSRCRASLHWDGGCYDCHGSATPQDPTTWRFEGDRYECEEGHWRKVAEANRPVVSPEVTHAVLVGIQRRLVEAMSAGPHGLPQGQLPVERPALASGP